MTTVSSHQAPHRDAQWLAVASVAMGTFALVTTEFLPIGLLSRISSELHVSEGAAGLAVTAPGLVAAVAGPLLAIAARELDRRTVMLALSASIVVSNLFAAFASSFAWFLAGRLVLGFAVGGLWTFAVSVGRRLVPESAGARATSIISMGISAGTVFGMPVGAVFEAWVGWRAVFAANAALSAAVVCLQLLLLPRLRATSAVGLRQLLVFAAIPMARVGLVASGLIAAGHFVAYTFLEPFLRGSLAFGQAGVAGALAGYAVAGIVGSFAGERLAVRNVQGAFVASAVGLGLSMLAAAATVHTPAGAALMVLMWGVTFGAWPVCVQMWMYTSSPALYEAGSALMVSAFQISLAAGAALGGVLVDARGVGSALLCGGVIALIGASVALVFRAVRLPVGDVVEAAAPGDVP